MEDAGAATRDPRPPLLDGDAARLAHATGHDTAGTRGTTGAGLPVRVPVPEQRALVVLQARRRGFRLGFVTTAGLCCAAVAVYVIALRASGAGLDGPLAETVLAHGAQVQAALADWLRRVIAPALS